MHFLFDSSLLGLYLATFASQPAIFGLERLSSLRSWTILLMAWPLMIAFVPAQPLAVAAVGLRANILLLPALLFGALLEDQGSKPAGDVAGGFQHVRASAGTGGIRPRSGAFYPENEVTAIIYMSKDVAGYSAYRIPSIFINAHAYAGTMVVTLPLLFGAWMQREQTARARMWIFCGLMAAVFGVLMASTRTHFVVLVIVMAVASIQMKISARRGLAGRCRWQQWRGW